MASGIDGHSVLLGDRVWLTGAHEGRPAFKLQTPFRMHNASLSLSSLVLLVLMVQEVLKLWYTVGVCDDVTDKSGT